MRDRLAKDPESATRWMGDARAVFWFLPILFIFTIVIGDPAGTESTNTMWLSYIAFPFLYAIAIILTVVRYEKEGRIPLFRVLGDAGLCMLPIGLHFLLSLPGWLAPYKTSTDLPFFYIADFFCALGTLLFLTLSLKALFPKNRSEKKPLAKES